MTVTRHIPVLLQEVLEWSNLSQAKTIVDGTLGGAGHALAIHQRLLPEGRLIGVDRDPLVISLRTQEWKAEFPSATNWSFHASSYAHVGDVLAELGIGRVDAILLDIGLSSDQLADRDRGFSFREDSPLDLRFNPEEGISAADLLAKVREEDLANLIYEFGEERFSRRIAKAICEQRRVEPVRTTKQLNDLIHRSVPGKTHGRIDCSTRTFQALRIAVNRELEHLSSALGSLPSLLSEHGRLMIISFHSLEDRLVKNAFRSHPLLNNLTKKPITASPQELAMNPRSRSAKMRVAERVSDDL